MEIVEYQRERGRRRGDRQRRGVDQLRQAARRGRRELRDDVGARDECGDGMQQIVEEQLWVAVGDIERIPGDGQAALVAHCANAVVLPQPAGAASATTRLVVMVCSSWARSCRGRPAGARRRG